MVWIQRTVRIEEIRNDSNFVKLQYLSMEGFESYHTPPTTLPHISFSPSANEFVSKPYLERLISLETRMFSQMDCFAKVGKEIDFQLEKKHGNTIFIILFGSIFSVFKKNCLVSLLMVALVVYSTLLIFKRLSRSVSHELKNLTNIKMDLLKGHTELVKEAAMLMEYVDVAIGVPDTTEPPTIRMNVYVRRLQTIVNSNYHEGYLHPTNMSGMYIISVVVQICLVFCITYLGRCSKQ
ncbi:hypothetical protein R3W88_014022 [Solanum pinnatisectum]|uniref:Uncharacterized protein n=1 Tax=Solanum pinnatisectum TaxID=50273 RepID=A0AAV9KST7_9SOLN|nr:hypothetical protein R3W88_014022 [Solanum pinnatisectum]